MNFLPDQNVVGTIYPSSAFKFDRETNTFLALISDVPQVLRELWADDLTIGFGIRSTKTGRVILFQIDTIKKHVLDPRITLFWKFVPTPEEIEKHPQLEFVTAKIYSEHYLKMMNE